MKKMVSKIWVPMFMVMVAAVQSFGIDAHRAVRLRGLADSLVLTRLDDTTTAEATPADSLKTDSIHTEIFTGDTTAAASAAADFIVIDTTVTDTLVLTARDTLKVPDSLKETDPFFYKYYIAVKDSVTRWHVRDSLIMAGQCTMKGTRVPPS